MGHRADAIMYAGFQLEDLDKASRERNQAHFSDDKAEYERLEKVCDQLKEDLIWWVNEV